MNLINSGARKVWLPLSLALATLASSLSAPSSYGQNLGGGSPPAGNAHWNARQQEAGYAARPLYPSTDQRYAVPQQETQAKSPAANAGTANTWQPASQPQANPAPSGQVRQLATFGQVPAQSQQTPAQVDQQGRAAVPYQRVASQTGSDRWQANNVTNVANQTTAGDGNDWIRDTEVVKKLNSDVDRMEMTVSTSRILTIEGKFSRAQVNNPEILSVTPLAPNELQISAQSPGITQVHLWDDSKRVYSLDVAVYGDVQELQRALQDQYPYSSVKVYRYSNSLVLTGYVDRPDYVSSIVRLSEDYAPKIINNMKVGGVQQILLNVQVMEVSRTKLRNMGFDFANINGDDFIISSISGLISATGSQTGTATGAGDTVRFGIVDGSNSFFGFLKLLRQHDLMKILAEPKLVTVSGRPASFNVGGEFPVLVPQSLGAVSIEYKKFGTQVDFLPIVLGNGNIRLEVRPRISEIDSTRSVEIQDFTVPALRVREIDTGVEMKAGQTLALAGLVQNRMEAQNKGIPVLADMPWLGAAFRTVQHTNNEIELLILVRPELVQAMDPHEVPQGGPGLNTVDPCDTDLYWRGHLEVPRCQGCNKGDCQDCQGRRNYDQFMNGGGSMHPQNGTPVNYPAGPQMNAVPQDPQARRSPTGPSRTAPAGRMSASNPVRTPSAYSPPVQTTASSQSNPTNRQATQNRYEPVRTAPQRTSENTPGMIGPLGYDVVK